MKPISKVTVINSVISIFIIDLLWIKRKEGKERRRRRRREQSSQDLSYVF